ncbi:hypothetical protein AXF42_Ash018213 [Apostasia shenzhenica]|uniref:Tf2-1-like SH3-like domain-containing protein n=1 Tax=Apostasia shenzhenica TaxID=1088818 RepID=A0A2I0B1C9_9ASPA|nr:hypothetical protein AXF42_Ash018213 [Apostasia shenzhenica]
MPRLIGPFEIIERIGAVAYRLALPPHLEGIHDIFHISMLKRYVSDPSHVIQYNPKRMKVRSDLSYKEKPIRILVKDVERLRNKEISMVKVLWSNQTERETTLEVEDEMKKILSRALYLNFEDEISQGGQNYNISVKI